MIQTTNIRRIMDRITRKKMLKDISFESVVEYTVDFISLLGVPAIYDEKTAKVKVSNWRGQLPCDFDSMIQVRESVEGKGYPAATYRYSGHSFHMSPDKINGNSGERTYKIQGMVIFTSVRDTELEIAYRAFSVDEEGYPLIPDNASFLRALESYIKMKVYEDKFDEGAISEAVMERADREYAFNVGHAHSEFSMPTLDQAETLFNSFKTLLPRNNEHWKGFFTNGSKEVWRH